MLYGEFDKSPIIFRYPQIKGVQWCRDIVPALRRYLRTYRGLKVDGYFNIESIFFEKNKQDDVQKYFETTARPKIDYNIKTRNFDDILA